MSSQCLCQVSSFLFDPDTQQSILSFNPLKALNPRNIPPDQAVLMPWVKLIVSSDPNDPDAEFITIGNNSQGTGNDANAAITSFQYGFSEGYSLTFEIIDVQGGNFCAFTDKLIKDLNDPNVDSPTNKVSFQWGIKGVNCSNSQSQPSVVESARQSCIHTSLIEYLSPTYVNGMFKFTLHCQDISEIYAQQVADIPFPNVTLVEAIKQLFKNNCKPPVDHIFYEMRDAAGILQSWEDQPQQSFFDSNNGKTGSMLGPVANWPAAGIVPLSVLENWLGKLTSVNKQGFDYYLDTPCNGNGIALRIRESEKPGCNKPCPTVPANQRKIYIVNGGSASQVISFNPSIKWRYIKSNKAGGGELNVEQGEKEQDEVNDCADDPSQKGTKVGLTTTLIDNEWQERVNGNQAAQKIIQADRAQFLADNSFESITAELKIQGDPYYNSITNKGEFITIVVLNPFTPTTNQNGCDWTIQTISGNNSNCNSVLSNTCWMIMGAFHEISGGSYTTTLKLTLAQQGVDLSLVAGLGG